jgi:hypothetical protein
MGTWHYDKKTLIEVLKKPIKVKDATSKIEKGLGDDLLFDYINELEDTLDKNEIINGKIIMFLRWEEPFLTEEDLKEINWSKTATEMEVK